MMKYFCLLLFLSSEARADSFSFRDRDKQLHMAASYGLALSSTLLMEKYGASRGTAVLLSNLGTMVIGTAKELFIDDSYSSGDQIANAIGTVNSAGFVLVFEL